MSPADSYIAGQPSKYVRALVVATWAVFGVAMLLLDAPSPRRVYYIINAVGLLGLGISIVWFVRAPKWGYASATASVFLISVYLLRWYLQVGDIYETNPTLGIGTAIERLVQVWTSVFDSNRARYGVLWALLAAYWDVLIVPVQFVAAGLVIISLRRSAGRIER